MRLPWAGTEVQVRLALVSDEHGRGPLVREVKLEGTLEGGATQVLGDGQVHHHVRLGRGWPR